MKEPTTSTNNRPRVALAASLLGFFMVTLDALIVNVALPSSGRAERRALDNPGANERAGTPCMETA